MLTEIRYSARLPSLEKDGVDGVISYIQKMNEELMTIMNFTGAGNLKGIDRTTLWNKNGGNL